MAKYGRYRDAEDRKNDASGKGDSDLVLVGLLLGFPFVITLGLAINSPNRIASSSTNNVITCPQAQSEWGAALDQRDAITPAEAMTYSGRAKWEQLRDKANELEQVRNNLCN